MGSLSLAHWLVVFAIVTFLFGAGKIPRLMSDAAKGVKIWKKEIHAPLEDVVSNVNETSAEVRALNPLPTIKKLGL
jgi:TatA/E family protein of Tat protein translocase